MFIKRTLGKGSHEEYKEAAGKYKRAQLTMDGRLLMSRQVRAARRLYWLAGLPLVCLLASTVQVAAQGADGVIAGTIKDAQGGVLPGVALTVRNTENGATRT